MVIIVILRIQFRLQPYKDKINNKIEELAIVWGFCTMYWTILIADDYKTSRFLIIIAIFLIIAHTYFIMQWAYYFLLSLKIKNQYFQYFMLIFGIIICKNGCKNTDFISDRPINSESKLKSMQNTKKKRVKKKLKQK